jgi:3-deoxy-D-manno-octulosonate 8-phosphate phosphatase (KDO 8-P phosphatase)
MSKARAKKIKLVLFDVDGVLTDGTIWLLPVLRGGDPGDDGAPHDRIEIKGFHAHDGAGVSLARLGGLKTGVITKRESETVQRRARDLKMDYILQGISDKRRALNEILEKENLRPEQAAYVGDDVIDLPPMRACGLAIAVANARKEVKAEAHIITEHAGGEGAARDAIEYILRAQGKFESVVAEYVHEPLARPKAKGRPK